MPHEIERKYLVNRELWDAVPKERFEHIHQLYLHADKEKAIRVRIMGDKAFITIKSKISTLKRLEFEYEIPLDDAKQMMEAYQDCPQVEKTRHFITKGIHTWEIDVFHGQNEGLILAEIELSSEEESFDIPNWVAEEVTHNDQYLNVNLAKPGNMKKQLAISLAAATMASCGTDTSEPEKSQESTESVHHTETEQAAHQELEIDTSPRVTGIGGIFFFSSDVEKTKEWYAENLGIQTNPWGSSFEFRNANNPNQINYLQWSPFSYGNEYFQPSKKDFMINYRVYNIEALVENFKANGVTILDSIQTYEYGKFVHIMDNDGNKIELWEPVDSIFTAMDGPTTK